MQKEDLEAKEETLIEAAKTVAAHYGYEPQSRQLIEEMAELIQAINKLYRKRNFGGTDSEIAEAAAQIEEEMADVLIMLLQVRFLLGTDPKKMFETMEEKMERQLKRINK